MTVSASAARLAANTPSIAAAHFRTEADPYHPAHNPGGYLNLGTAENRLVWDLLAPRLTAGRPLVASDVHYAPLHGRYELRRALASLLERRFGDVSRAEVRRQCLRVGMGLVSELLADCREGVSPPAPR